jgi:hypothetical protein
MVTHYNFSTFIQNHNKYFKKYDNFKYIEKSSVTGWLYIFNASSYDYDITHSLPEFTDKFGETEIDLYSRLYQYKDKVNIQNIEVIQCSFPKKRERLVKAYLNLRTQIKPIVGKEYFSNCRNLIKVLILIIKYISDDDIIKYEKSYSKHSKDDTEYNILFDKIEEYIKQIKENDEFNIINNLKQTKYVCEINNKSNALSLNLKNTEKINETTECEYCKKSFANINNLKIHQRTAKFCLQIQNKQAEVIYECDYCKKNYNIKSNFNVHVLLCKEKKAEEDKNETIKMNKKIKELEKQLNEYKLKLSAKDELNKNLKEYSKKLEKTIQKLINNNTNNYQVQNNQDHLYLLEKYNKEEDVIENLDSL